MNIAELYPPVTDGRGVTWWRPVRDAGADVSQWGWTSDPAQAHPDYDALNTCTCPYVDPSLWTTHYGAVEPGSQREQNPLCPVHPATVADLVVAHEAPVVAAAAERAAAVGSAWSQVLALAAAGDVPPVRELGDPQALVDAAAFGVSHVAVGWPERPGDRLPLSRSWSCDDQGRTMSGASVCGTCDGGGCFDCVD